jgi:hypothetical protein
MNAARNNCNAIARRATLVAVHGRSRDSAMQYARNASGQDRSEWVVLARMYQRSMREAQRKARQIEAVNMDYLQAMIEVHA